MHRKETSQLLRIISRDSLSWNQQREMKKNSASKNILAA